MLSRFLDWIVDALTCHRQCSTFKCCVNFDGECCYVAMSPFSCPDVNKPDYNPGWVML